MDTTRSVGNGWDSLVQDDGTIYLCQPSLYLTYGIVFNSAVDHSARYHLLSRLNLKFCLEMFAICLLFTFEGLI